MVEPRRRPSSREAVVPAKVRRRRGTERQRSAMMRRRRLNFLGCGVLLPRVTEKAGSLERIVKKAVRVEGELVLAEI